MAARYVVEGRRVRFRLGAYDPRLPLVIDPCIEYATFLGGSGDDRGHALAVDSEGNAYVTGVTTSLDFPVTNGWGTKHPRLQIITIEELLRACLKTQSEDFGRR